MLRKSALLLLCLVALTSMAQTKVSTTTLKNMYNTVKYGETSVHDPSVVYNPSDKKFYIFGSHLGAAYTSDLKTWVNFGGGESAACNLFATPSGSSVGFADAYNVHAVKKVKNLLGEEVDFGNFNAHEWQRKDFTVQGNQWAPDVIYNPNSGKWLMYMSLNGDNWGAVIVCLAADKITGPYVYQGPVVFSGFQGSYDHNGFTKTNDWTHTDFAIATGATSLPTRYKTGSSWGTYWPNCIDPNVFFDQEGNLWLIYGSWSGGIFMLKMDKQTGLRDYTYKYPYQVNGSTVTPGSVNANCTSDPYFGKKIAGGYYVSGEGPYIRYINGYYYLFMSYGFFSPDGGYEMRIFRSDKPDGPYKDASGNVATYTAYQMNYGPKAVTNKGMKILGAFNNWGTMTVGECAEGHNSAIVDEKGNAFVVYHTKFNDGTAGHLVRVRQLFQNEKGWLVAAPFRHTSGINPATTQTKIESEQIFSDADIVGTYQLLIHPYRLDYEKFAEAKPVTVKLNADGTISGDRTGSWKISVEGKSYVTLTIAGVIYYGVLMEQGIDGYSDMPAVCLTAVSNSGVPVWLYKPNKKASLAFAYKDYEASINGVNKSKFTANLPSGNEDTYITYDCTNYTTKEAEPETISPTGKFTPTSDGHKVALKAKFYNYDNTYWAEVATNVIKATAVRGDCYSGLKAYYKLDATTCANIMNTTEKISVAHAGTGTTPTIYSDADHGKVLHQYFGAQANASYTKMNNPLYGSNAEGMTIGMWVKRLDSNVWDALFSFFGGTTPAAEGGRFYVTGNSYLGYNDAAGNWFDVNHPNNGTYTDIPVNQWAFITLTVDASGYTFYVNGNAMTRHAWAGSVSATAFNYSQLLSQLKNYAYIYLGMGSFWGSAPAYFSNVVVYDRALPANDVSYLCNRMGNGEFDPFYTPGDADGDGKVTIADANMVVNYYLGNEVPGINLKNADVDGDGKVTIVDANMIVNMYLQ